MPSTVPLNESEGSAPFDSSGAATVQLGPGGPQEQWSPANVHVKTNQAPAAITNEAQCFIYAGPAPTDAYFIDSTSSGSTGDVTDAASAYQLGRGEYIWAVWHGGDPGAQGVVRVTGTKVI